MFKKISFTIFLFTFTYSLQPTYLYAIDIESPRFKIEINELNINSEKEKEPAIYTIQSLYGPEIFEQFKSQGYAIPEQEFDKPLVFSLSNSLINFSNLASNQILQEKVTFSISSLENPDFKVNLIQEYPLKNFSGGLMDLDYSLGNEDIFRPLPNQNTGESATLILQGKKQDSGRLTFKLNPPSHDLEGTYETVINYIATPGY